MHFILGRVCHSDLPQSAASYADLLEFRNAVDPQESASVLAEARIAEIYKRLREEWFWLSDHRSQHHPARFEIRNIPWRSSVE
jgi:hypothetical protein